MILYTMVPVLKPTLLPRGPEATNFWHWMVLYNEICQRLTKDVIAKDEIPIFELLIDKWQQLVPRFLGESNCTFNIHATRHMPKYVRLLGPVHNYNASAFEVFKYGCSGFYKKQLFIYYI